MQSWFHCAPRDPRPLVRAGGAALVLMLVIGAQNAIAEIIPCTGVSERGLKLLLDDVVRGAGSGRSEAVMLALLQRVDASLMQVELEGDSKVGTHPAATPAKNVRVIRCPNRWPASPSDFDEPTVRGLSNNQVVIEVWGHTSPLAQGQGHLASVGYALVPILYFENDGDVPSVVVVSRQTKAVDTVEDLMAVLDQSGRLSAYTATAAGLRLLRARSYDQARTQLCSAQAKLDKLRSEGIADDQLLLDYVKGLAGEAVTKARADGQYRGPLKLITGTECRLGAS